MNEPLSSDKYACGECGKPIKTGCYCSENCANADSQPAEHIPSKYEALCSRLRQRLITVPRPGAQAFKPTYPISFTYTTGTVHKAGDSAGYQTFNPTAAACAAGYDPNNWMAIEHIFVVDPLMEEAAQALEAAGNKPTPDETPAAQNMHSDEWWQAELDRCVGIEQAKYRALFDAYAELKAGDPEVTAGVRPAQKARCGHGNDPDQCPHPHTDTQ